MTSISNKYCFQNLSLCVYIGNTSSIDDTILLNYCSRFGKIVSSLSSKEKFCDFHIIEFLNSEQLENFLNVNIHEMNGLILDVKFYKHILTNNEILNLDRKFFLGPILNFNDINKIKEFYKTIHRRLYCYLIEQDHQSYLLFEFTNRQSVSTIFEKQTIPVTNEHRTFSLVKPLHPKEFVNKIISMKTKQNQIYIRGLTDHITETMLIDYFHKYAPVIACHIFFNDSKCAYIEFNDEKTVRKILDLRNIRLQGVNYVLNKASRPLASLLSSTDNNDDDDDIEIQSKPSISLIPASYQQNIQQSFVNPTSSPILIPSPENNNNESGWSSPPRTVFTHCPSIDQAPVRSSSNPTSINNTDPIHRLTTIDIDTKPIKTIPSIFEQFQLELDQLKDEYKSKFLKDQKSVDQEIDLLINEERQTFNKLNRYLNDHRRGLEKTNNNNNNNKRKYSSASTTD